MKTQEDNMHTEPGAVTQTTGGPTRGSRSYRPFGVFLLGGSRLHNDFT